MLACKWLKWGRERMFGPATRNGRYWREAAGDGLMDRSDQAYLSEPRRTKDQDISKVGLKGEKARKSGLSSIDRDSSFYETQE